MRVALISDIHGNLHALDLVLEDLAKARVDQVICLGDVASLGPQPREVIARLRELAIPSLAGNHEAYLLNPALTENQHPWLRAAEQWCLGLLSPEDLEFLRSFPSTLSIALGPESTLMCYHGSPRSNEDWLHPTTPPDFLDEVFGASAAPVRAGGHTHVQMMRLHRGAMLLNPGSVGMPLEFPKRGPEPRALPWAEYAILETVDGRVDVHFHRLPIDFQHLAQVARASGLPDAEYWISTWLI